MASFVSPDETDAKTEEFVRATVPFARKYQRFVVNATKRRYTQQFSHMYNKRAAALRPVLVSAVRKDWGSKANLLVSKINDLTSGSAVIIGTVFKAMDLKPSVLDEFSFEKSGQVPETRDNYVSADDELFLEDPSGRVCLIGDNLPIGTLVTGTVIAVFGLMNAHGEMLVKDICFPGIAPQPALRVTAEGSPFVMLVSGLDIGPSTDMLPFQLLQEFVGGLLGSPEALTKKQLAAIAEPTKTADVVISQLTRAVDTDIMPGSHDPSNFTMPQQPLHPCLFPHSSRFSGFHAVTNPYEADIGGVRFLGTSGQPLDDMRKFMSPVGETGLQSIKSTNAATEAVAPAAPDSDAAGKVDEDGDGDVVMGEAETGTSRKDLKKPKLVLSDLCKTLTWRHMAPTAPDTLGCYPFFEEDPFVLESSPHVYFAGNQDAFASCTVPVPDSEGFVRVITVPRFSTTHTAVLLNLRTLDARPVVFSAE